MQNVHPDTPETIYPPYLCKQAQLQTYLYEGMHYVNIMCIHILVDVLGTIEHV